MTKNERATLERQFEQQERLIAAHERTADAQEALARAADPNFTPRAK